MTGAEIVATSTKLYARANNRRSIVVCGEALIDVIRHSDGTENAALGGGPYNTARAVARLGPPVAFMGHLSDDERGQRLAAALEMDGVSLEYATVGHERTTIALAELDRLGRATFRFEVEGTSAPNLRMADIRPDVEAIHLGSLGLVLEPMADTLVSLADREHGRRMLMLDPNIRVGLAPDDQYRERVLHVLAQSTVVKASDTDLAWLYPGIDYERAALRILERGVDLVVVTLGAEGAFGAVGDNRVRVAAPKVRVVDTIGAGDVFGAALLAWLHDHDRISPKLVLDEQQLTAALEYACRAAAITCTRAGADPPLKSELIRA